MQKKRYDTAFKILSRIAGIKDEAARTEALRTELTENQSLAIAIQYTYHPDVEFLLPRGELPENIAKKSPHDEPGPFFFYVKKLRVFTDPNIPQKTREVTFINMYESIAGEDVAILVGIKDKRMPWPELSGAFCAGAVPELFPTGFVELPEEVVEPTEFPEVPDVVEGPEFTANDAARFLQENEETPAPVKRGRGRPRKNKQ